MKLSGFSNSRRMGSQFLRYIQFGAILATFSFSAGKVAYSEEKFEPYPFGYDLVVGRQGSDIRLVLSTVYRMGNPPPILPYRYYLELKNDPLVEEVVPIAIGDMTEKGGFPILATSSNFFDLEYAVGKKFDIQGKAFGDLFSAIIGSEVAETNGWMIDNPATMKDEASVFQLVHGSDPDGHLHPEEFRVVGILKETNTPNDQTVFVSLQSFYAAVGHLIPSEEAKLRENRFFGGNALEVQGLSDSENQETDTSQKWISAIFVKAKGGIAGPMLKGKINHGFRAQAVQPTQVLTDFHSLAEHIAPALQPIDSPLEETVDNPQIVEPEKDSGHQAPNQNDQFFRGLQTTEIAIFTFLVALIAVGVIPLWIICKKAGFPGWYGLAALVPLLNVALLFFLAFTRWPRRVDT